LVCSGAALSGGVGDNSVVENDQAELLPSVWMAIEDLYDSRGLPASSPLPKADWLVELQVQSNGSLDLSHQVGRHSSNNGVADSVGADRAELLDLRF
jgi:hypothetical protein